MSHRTRESEELCSRGPSGGSRHRRARPVAGKDVRHQRPCERINETATDSQAGERGVALH